MPEPSEDFGAFLKDARERAGVSLRHIASSTKISMPALEALERNDVSRLPGGIFTRAFIRAYASEVGLEPEDAVARFIRRFPDPDAEQDIARGAGVQSPSEHEAAGRGRFTSRAAWVVPLLLVVAYFGLGGRLPALRDAWFGPGTVTDAPSPVVDSGKTPGAQPSPPVRPAQFEAVAPAPVPPPLSDAGAPAAAAGPVAAAAVRAAGTPNGVVRLVIAPTARCWVQVTGDDGRIVFSGEVQASERRELELGGGLSLKVGDAGAFAFTINGEPGRSLGGQRQVVTVRITPANFRDYLAGR